MKMLMLKDCYRKRAYALPIVMFWFFPFFVNLINPNMVSGKKGPIIYNAGILG